MADSKEQLFKEKFSKLIDGEAFDMDTELKFLENWDSLASVDFLGIADEDFGKELDPMDVRSAGTVGDLYELLTKED